MNIKIQRAEAKSLSLVSSVLRDAAKWLESKGQPLWKSEWLTPENLEREPGSYYLARVEEENAGVYRFQEEDTLFWPESPTSEATYIHRLSVRRAFAGKGIASMLIQHATEMTKAKNRRFLRLDCDSTRPKLRTFYEGLGFRFHSLKQIGDFSAARYELKLEANQSPQLPKDRSP